MAAKVRIPPLPGSVQPQMVRCGGAWRQCTKDGRLHGPYFYRFHQINGKQREEYIQATIVQMCGERQHAEWVLSLDPDNVDAQTFLAASGQCLRLACDHLRRVCLREPGAIHRTIVQESCLGNRDRLQRRPGLGGFLLWR